MSVIDPRAKRIAKSIWALVALGAYAITGYLIGQQYGAGPGCFAFFVLTMIEEISRNTTRS